jgi:excisionase family DNA binding protein
MMVKITGDMLTITQAAAYLKTSRQNIYAAIERGRLKTTKVGAILLVKRSALTAYAKTRKRTGRPPRKKG